MECKPDSAGIKFQSSSAPQQSIAIYTAMQGPLENSRAMTQAGHDAGLQAPIGFEDLFKILDVVALVGVHQVGHGLDLRVVLVGLGLLGIERIHLALHQHVGQDQILQRLDASPLTCLVITLECLQDSLKS